MLVSHRLVEMIRPGEWYPEVVRSRLDFFNLLVDERWSVYPHVRIEVDQVSTFIFKALGGETWTHIWVWLRAVSTPSRRPAGADGLARHESLNLAASRVLEAVVGEPEDP